MIYQRKPINKTLILIVLIVVISVIYLWYFLIYIKGNERMLTEKGYRVLSRIEGNMENKITDQFVRFDNYGSLLEQSSELRDLTYFTYDIDFIYYYYNLEIRDDSTFRENFQYFELEIREAIDFYNSQIQKFKSDYPKLQILGVPIDQLNSLQKFKNNISREENKIKDVLNKNNKILNAIEAEQFSEFDKEDIISGNDELDKKDENMEEDAEHNKELYVVKNSDIKASENASNISKALQKRSKYPYYLAHHIMQSDKSEDEHPLYYVPIKLFMGDIGTSDFFYNVGIYGYREVDSDSILSLSPVYNSVDFFGNNDLLQKMYQDDKQIIGPFSFDSKIADTDYKTFVKPVRIRDWEFYLVGFADQNLISQKAKSINPYVLLLISSIIIILIVAYPFFKLFFLDKHERLVSGDLYQSGISLIFGCAFILLFFVNIYYHFFVDKYVVKNNMEELSNSIRNGFLDEIYDLYDQLESADSIYLYDRNKLIQDKNVSTDWFFKKTPAKKDYDSLFQEINRYIRTITDKNLSAPVSQTNAPVREQSGPNNNFVEKLFDDSRINKNNDFLYIDSNGLIKTLITKNPTQKDDSMYVSDREYYKRIIGDTLFQLIRKKSASLQENGTVSANNSDNPIPDTDIDREISDTIKFALQSLYSWKTGKPEVVLSRPFTVENTDIRLSAIASEEFSSLFNPILPMGYQFCVIDKEGEVLFHSDISHNLRENFIKEVGERDRLLSAVHSGVSEFMQLRYHEEIHRAFISPIHGMDMTLVILHSASLDQVKDFMIFIYCLAIIIGIMLLIVLITIIVKAVAQKSSRLKRRKFSYDWLLPTKNKTGYIYKLAFNYMMIIIMIIMLFKIQNLVHAILFHSFIILFTSASNFYLFNSREVYLRNKFFLKNVFKTQNDALMWHQILHWILIFFVILLLGKVKADGLIILAIVFLVVFYISVPYAIDFLINHYDRLKKQAWFRWLGFKYPYKLFIYTWLIVASMIPTLWYYKIVTKNENDTWSKASMYYMGEKAHQQLKKEKFRELKDLTYYGDPLKYRVGVNDSTMYKEFLKDQENESQLDSIQNNLLGDLRVGIGAVYFNHNYIPVFNMIENNSNLHPGWIKTKNHYLKYGNTLYFRANSKAQSFVIEKPAFGFITSFKKLERIEKGSFILLGILGGLVLMAILFWLIKMMADKALNLKLYKLFSKKILYNKRLPLENHAKYFITSPPGSGLTRYLISELEQKFGKDKVYVVDMHVQDLEAESKKIKSKSYKAVLIKSFDYNLFNFDKNSEKIKLFENVTQQQDLTVIVRSAVEIDYLFEIYDEKIQEYINNKSDYADSVSDLDRWESLFRNFTQLHLPMHFLQEDYMAYRKVDEKTKIINPAIENELKASEKLWNLSEFIFQMKEDELRDMITYDEVTKIKSFLESRGKEEKVKIISKVLPDSQQTQVLKMNAGKLSQFIANMEPDTIKDLILLLDEDELESFLKEMDFNNKSEFVRKMKKEELRKHGSKYKEKMILQVQRLANTYYHSIWNNCSNSEKLLIFDLAEDGLLNSADTLPLKNLYHKGIIQFDDIGRPCLFNESFANFVLESSKIEEAKNLENEYKKRGSWDTYRVVLITIIIALVVFFVLAERQFLDRFNSMTGMFLAIIPALFKASEGLFSLPFLKRS